MISYSYRTSLGSEARSFRWGIAAGFRISWGDFFKNIFVWVFWGCYFLKCFCSSRFCFAFSLFWCFGMEFLSNPGCALLKFHGLTKVLQKRGNGFFKRNDKRLWRMSFFAPEANQLRLIKIFSIWFACGNGSIASLGVEHVKLNVN